jgi:hypothetical protein
MEIRSIALITGLSLGLLCACGEPPTDPNPTETLVRASLQPPNAHWLSDYLPRSTHRYGIRTFYWFDEESFQTSLIVGTETVPYLSGPVDATLVGSMEDGDSEVNGISMDGKETWFSVITDGYYLSVDCDLTAYPPDRIVGKVWDGLFLGDSEPAKLVKRDGSECLDAGNYDFSFPLFKIDDITLYGDRLWVPYMPWNTIERRVYRNALVIYDVAKGEPYTELDFWGLEDEMGITLPTAEETGGWDIDGFGVFALHEGLVAQGDFDVGEGELDDFALLVSRVPMASVPVHWATGGGTVDWGQYGRVTYGFAAAVDAGGEAAGTIQFNWRDNDREFHGTIDCLNVLGNRAYASGVATSGDWAGDFFFFGVEDNGEGSTASGPDLLSPIYRREGTPWDCREPYEFGRPWTNGNVQVK